MKSINNLRRRLLLTVTVQLVALGCISPNLSAATVVKTYAADNTSFANPERGFHNRYDLVPGGETNFSRSTNAGNTLVHSYIRLDNYRNSYIPQSLLDQLSNGLAAARNQGKKVILRASYNFGPYPDSEPDASEYWIGQHLAQLSPVLEANKDVIAYLEAGFIGAWGEWHTSTNSLDTDSAAKIRIADTMLQNVPDSLQVALRYPSDVRSLISGGVSSSRLGNHQDCFLASDPDDWGTWGRDAAYTIAQDKEFIAEVGENHPVGGETCNVDSGRVNCSTAMAELQQMHFSELNEDFDTGVINVFKNQGCYNDIDQKLGYRFRLLQATYPNAVNSGSSFALKLQLTNDGFASPYNQRPAFAVLDGSEGTFTFALATDPRQWKSGQQVDINQTITLPTAMPGGTYRLSLWLPDPALNLRSDARYSIRFANQNTWDSASAYNVLANDIEVSEGGIVEPTVTPTPTPTTPSGVTRSYEAEAANNILNGDAVISNCDSCSGNTKVGYLGNNSGMLQFSNVFVETAGNYTLSIYYISGNTRSAQIRVNEESPVTVSFGSTGSWTTVGSMEVELTLHAGNNAIHFSNTTGWAPDIDRITISGTDDGTGPPTTSLILDDFDNASQWPGKNDLNRWTGANGFNNDSGALDNEALVLQYNNDGWFGSEVAQDISSKTYLVMVIKGAAGGEEDDFHITLGGVEKSFAALSGDSIATSYKTVRIDLAAHGINRTTPGQLQMSFWWGGSGEVSIDGIWFE